MKTLCAAIPLVVWMSLSTSANAGLIDFDTDAGGKKINAGYDIEVASAPRDLYAPLGVTFLGAGPQDGGAILRGGSPLLARSGQNYLAFYDGVDYLGGGAAGGPETIVFSQLQHRVSLFAMGELAGSFRLTAYRGGEIVDEATVTLASYVYGELAVADDAGFDSVVFERLGRASVHPYFVDDISFSAVPAPGSAVLLGVGAIAMTRRRR
jgi:hypothetical protein